VHRGKFCFATEGNVVNPKIGSDLQYGREVEEEETVEVVKNHEGGTQTGIGVPISKVVPGNTEMQQSRKVELWQSGAWYLRSHGAMQEASMRKRSEAEGGAKRQPRGDTELSERCGNAERWRTGARRGKAERGAGTA
jgi:hypothetical protein